MQPSGLGFFEMIFFLIFYEKGGWIRAWTKERSSGEVHSPFAEFEAATVNDGGDEPTFFFFCVTFFCFGSHSLFEITLGIQGEERRLSSFLISK